MKKLLTALLTMTLLLSLCACGGNQNNADPSTPESGYEDVSGSDSDMISDEDDAASDADTAIGGDIDSNSDAETNSDKQETPKEPANEVKNDAPAKNPPVEQKPAANTQNTQTPSNDNKADEGSKNDADQKADEGEKDTTQSQGASGSYSGTLSALVDGIYAIKPLDMSMGGMDLDLTDLDSLQYFTGLRDASLIREAYVSEPMIGSSAYSLVVVRANSAADAATLAQNMFDNINQSKWICVTAHNLAVGTCGDIAMLVMSHNDFGSDLPAAMRSAFASVCGGTLENTQERTIADGAGMEGMDGIVLG